MEDILIEFKNEYTVYAKVICNVLTEVLIDSTENESIINNIYLGVITKVLPSNMIFVDIGRKRNAFINMHENKGLFSFYKFNNSSKQLIGRKLLVQVIRDERNSKCCKAITKCSFNSSHFSLILDDKGYVDDKNIKKELCNFAKSRKPQGSSIVMRSKDNSVSDAILQQELTLLINKTLNILKIYEMHAEAPKLLHKAGNMYSSLEALITHNTDRIIVNKEEEIERISNSIKLSDNIELKYCGNDILEDYFVKSQFVNMFKNKVWLRSGGFILIEETQTCTAIDVNTGKFLGKRSYEDTIFKVNIESYIEIAKQIKLRNLSGTILVDFINMKDADNNQKLISRFRQELKNNKTYTRIIDVTCMGLMQLARKRIRNSNLNMLTSTCKACGGTGRIIKYI